MLLCELQGQSILANQVGQAESPERLAAQLGGTQGSARKGMAQDICFPVTLFYIAALIRFLLL